MTSKLRRLVLTLLTFSFISTVPGETQMCGDLFKDAEVSVLPPNSASPCVSVRLDSGRLQNSLVLTLSINRSSEECTVPTNFVVTLQVINRSGYPVGDLGKSFSVYESFDKSQLAYSEFPSLPTPIFQPSKVQNIPCSRHTEDKPGDSQDGTKVGPTLALIEFSPEQRKAQSFASRVVWTFSSGNGNSSSAPNQLAALGELVDKESNKVLQFVSLNQVALNDSDGSLNTPECTEDQKTCQISKTSLGPSADDLKTSRSKRAATSLPHQACRKIKPAVPRVLETPQSMDCLSLDAYASFSTNNAVFLALTYPKDCPEWKTDEWILHAYNEKGYPAGTLSQVGSFMHYSEAGLSYDFKCDISNVSTVVRRLDGGRNVQCRHTGGTDREWLLNGVMDTLTPSTFHVKSTEFLNAGGNAGVFFIWQFENRPMTSPPTRLKTIRFLAEAYIPSLSQPVVLILRSRHEVTLHYKSPTSKPKRNSTLSCFTEENSATISRGGSFTELPDPTYTMQACGNKQECEDLPVKPPLQQPFYVCKAWRPTEERVEAGDCLRLDSFATRQENSVMVMLLMESACLPEYTVEDFIIQAVNQHGYPVGKVGESFVKYEDKDPDQCVLGGSDRHYVEYNEFNHLCFYDGGRKDKFIQEVSANNTPTMFYGQPKVGELFSRTLRYNAFRAVWRYSQPLGYNGTHPTEIRFLAELYVPGKKFVAVVKSSRPLHLNYIPSPTLSTNRTASCFQKNTSSVTLDPVRSNTPKPNAQYIDKCKANPSQCSVPAVPVQFSWTTPAGGTTELVQIHVVDGRPPQQPPPVITGNSPPTTLSPLKKKKRKPTDVYDGCEKKTKGCIVPSKGKESKECFKTRSCDLIIAFQRQDQKTSDDVVVIEMYHRDPGEWFAVGLNPTQARMAGAYVLECVDEGRREGPVIYNSYNAAGSEYRNKRYREDGPEAAKLIVQLQESYRRGLEIYCRFHIKEKFFRTIQNKAKQFVHLNKQPFFIIAAWGHDQIAGAQGNLIKHDPKHFMRPEDTVKTILGARYSPNSDQSPLIIAHGILMAWAFVFCLPVGIFTARFLKETFPNVKLCKRFPLWLVIHVASMTLAVMLFVIAMINEIQGHAKWVSQRKSAFHSYLGGILGGLFIMNFVLGWFVKVTKHGEGCGNPTGMAHGLLGHFVCLTGFVVILKMDAVAFGNAPCEAKWIVGGMIFSYVVIYGVMSYHYWWVDWVVGLTKGRGFVILPIGVLTEGYVTSLLISRSSRELNTRALLHLNSDDIIEAPGARVRIGGVIILTMLGFMYTSWTHIIIMFNEPESPCVPLDRYQG